MLHLIFTLSFERCFMRSKSIVRNFLTLLTFLISPTAFTYPIDWNSLDRYLGMRSRDEIITDLRILLQQENEEVRRHFENHIKIKDDRIDVISDIATGTVEYSFAFQAMKPRVAKLQGKKTLSGYNIAVDGNNLSSLRSDYFPLTQEISSLLAGKLRAEGANVLLTRSRASMGPSEYAPIVDEVFAASPDIALAVRFKSGGTQQPNNTFVSFCPGCFMKGELATERFRFRFMHALVSGKVWESSKLAAHIAAKVRDMRCGIQLLEDVNTFGEASCGIPMNREMAETCASIGLLNAGVPRTTVPGVLGRNLFFNSIPSQVNVWLNPGDDLMSKSAEEIAEAYFQGVVSYVQRETENTERQLEIDNSTEEQHGYHSQCTAL